jgi:hypothetical protein
MEKNYMCQSCLLDQNLQLSCWKFFSVCRWNFEKFPSKVWKKPWKTLRNFSKYEKSNFWLFDSWLIFLIFLDQMTSYIIYWWFKTSKVMVDQNSPKVNGDLVQLTFSDESRFWRFQMKQAILTKWMVWMDHIEALEDIEPWFELWHHVLIKKSVVQWIRSKTLIVDLMKLMTVDLELRCNFHWMLS